MLLWKKRHLIPIIVIHNSDSETELMISGGTQTSDVEEASSDDIDSDPEDAWSSFHTAEDPEEQ